MSDLVANNKVEILNSGSINSQDFGRMQRTVDDYIGLYKKYKKLKNELDSIKKIIEPFMLENELTELNGFTSDGSIAMSTQERPQVTARYTTYDMATIGPLLTPKAKTICVVSVLDKEAIEALHKLGQVSDEIFKMKNTKTTHVLSVKEK